MKLLYFRAKWCDPCRNMNGIVENIFNMDTIKDEYSLEKIDVDDNIELCYRMKINSVPTFVILDEQGKEKARHSGLWAEHKMLEWMSDFRFRAALRLSSTKDVCNITLKERSMLHTIKRALGLTSSDEVTGSVSSFAGSFAPYGFADCSGQLISISNKMYTPLFSVIGTIYGGDGITNFALPDLRPTDKKGNKIDWTEAGIPRQVICLNGRYPQRP